ncbi:MAG: hypothetical protein ACE5JK_07645 [Candidatus Omnitrophota bacterium]
MSKNPETHTITIKLEGDQVECDPRRLIANRNDSIEFKCEDGFPFAVHFHPTSPAQKVRFRSGSSNQVKATIRDDVLSGRYEFFIALCDKEMNIWMDDPDIIIPPG